jgi:hypothetical protein
MKPLNCKSILQRGPATLALLAVASIGIWNGVAQDPAKPKR